MKFRGRSSENLIQDTKLTSGLRTKNYSMAKGTRTVAIAFAPELTNNTEHMQAYILPSRRREIRHNDILEVGVVSVIARNVFVYDTNGLLHRFNVDFLPACVHLNNATSSKIESCETADALGTSELGLQSDSRVPVIPVT